MTGSTVWAALSCALLASGVLLACGEPTYLFLGRRYSPIRNCLEGTTSIDVLEGSDPGNCEARCVTAPVLGDGGPAPDAGAQLPSRDTFVSTMCPPLPHGIESASSSDAVCTQALAALARKDTCLRDGGSTAPVPANVPDASDASPE